MGYVAIMDWTVGNRVAKYASFVDLAAAEAHVANFSGKYPNAFVTTDPGDSTDDWLVDPVARTVSVSAVPLTKNQVNGPIFAQIALKERAALRPMRELRRAQEFADVSASDVIAARSRLKTLDDEIKALRAQLQL